jgi:hypothetical protein
MTIRSCACLFALSLVTPIAVSASPVLDFAPVAALPPGTTAVAPLTYTMTFTASQGTAPTSGSFSYDPVSTIVTNLQLIWLGTTYQIPNSLALHPLVDPTGPNSGCSQRDPSAGFLEDGTPQVMFLLLSGVCGTPQYFVNYAGSVIFETTAGVSPSIFDFSGIMIPPPTRSAGTLTIQLQTSVPEPQTLPLVAAAFVVGLRWVSRKTERVRGMPDGRPDRHPICNRQPRAIRSEHDQ